MRELIRLIAEALLNSDRVDLPKKGKYYVVDNGTLQTIVSITEADTEETDQWGEEYDETTGTLAYPLKICEYAIIKDGQVKKIYKFGREKITYHSTDTDYEYLYPNKFFEISAKYYVLITDEIRRMPDELADADDEDTHYDIGGCDDCSSNGRKGQSWVDEDYDEDLDFDWLNDDEEDEY